MIKHTPLVKSLITLFTFVILISCKNDDGVIRMKEDLIGTWQRSDASDQFEYILTFEDDNDGFRIVREENDAGQVISSARSFIWTTNNMQLTIDCDGEDIVETSFEFDEGDHLLLADLTELHFVKVE